MVSGVVSEVTKTTVEGGTNHTDHWPLTTALRPLATDRCLTFLRNLVPSPAKLHT